MEKILPIGSVITLKNGSLKVMIIARYPLYKYKNRIGFLTILVVYFLVELLTIRHIFLITMILKRCGLQVILMRMS